MKVRRQRLSLPRYEPGGWKMETGGVGLYIPVVPLSANRLMRTHGIRRWREQGDMQWLIKKAGEHLTDQKQKLPAAVTFARVGMRPIKDDDNLVFAFKPMRDCLVKEGWLVDDSPEWGTFKAEQLRPNDNLRPGTYITIEYRKETLETV
jgi:hypothetical protein